MPIKKRILLRALVLLILLPVINSFGLRILYAYEIKGNIAYDKIAPIISGAISFIEVAVVFSGFGLFLRAFYSCKRKTAGAVLVFNVISALISYLAAVLLVYVTTANPAENLPFMMVYGMLNFAADLVILASVTAVALITEKSHEKRGRPAGERLFWQGCIWSGIIFGVAGLIQKAGETVTDIMEFGAPVLINDYIYLITPYLRLAVYSVLGVFVAYLVGTFGLKDPTSQTDTSSDK